ncbi:MAG: arginase family protein [Chitinophagaceae bacterium]|nr:MAG: arginase family protein [Chitinophagaceae bacterium]
MKDLVIVEFPSNLGLKETAPGQEPGVRRLPAWLQKHGLHAALSPAKVYSLEAPPYDSRRDPQNGYLNPTALATYAMQQAALLGGVLNNEQFPFILGGDCSILLGTALALKQRGNYGLFYLDGHTDFMDISLSETGGVGGMVASLVTGNGAAQLSNMASLSPYICEEDLCCVGNREYDAVYEAAIQGSKATYVSLAELRRQGIHVITSNFLDRVARRQPDGFWLHIDVDVLNDEIMPCVDSRTPDGLHYAEFNELCGYLFSSPLLAGIEITILDPDRDPDGKHTKAFVSNISETFNSSRKTV